MKLNDLLKTASILGLLLGLTMGCATSEQAAEEPAPQAAPEAKPEPTPPPAATAEPAPTGSYQVVRGDNLWNISGKSEIYGNPYQWPLIYKANSAQIKDADLIYPGQNLAINTNPSAGDVDAAVRHAKTRGSWSLGVVEESDKAYLAQ